MRRTKNHWPNNLYLVRHGQSCGNVARDAAEAGGLPEIAIEERDMDVALSEFGQQQATAVGAWLQGLRRRRPEVVLSSPYLRAVETARLALGAARLDDVEVVVDERLREREFGALDRLTRGGIEARFPNEAAARARLGKFYHRPPGGESWCDVGLRVRSLVDSMSREHAGRSVMIVAHQVVILMFRYVLERMTEQEILAIDKSGELGNCSITAYTFDRHVTAGGGLRLTTFNDVRHLAELGRPITAEPDRPVTVP